jgi:hypothetical protein
MPVCYSTDPMLLDCVCALSLISLIILYAVNIIFFFPSTSRHRSLLSRPVLM